MTREEAELVDQIILSSERILDALRASLEDVQGLQPLDASRIGLLTKQDRLLLDAFLRRFETAVEGGRRLFRAGLIQREEPLDGLSLIDVVNRAEKLHILDSAPDWRAAMRVRNVVVHEYAMDAVSASEAVGNAINIAGRVAELLEAALTVVKRQRQAGV
jgi:hypothetical protein